MSYKSIFLKSEFDITQIFTIHYFEYMNNFVFPGESHDFWEFLCVDKGTVDITSEDTVHHLAKGDLAFHKPNEFHTVTANGQSAPNLVVISFQCNSPFMDFFRDQILKIDETERNLLGAIIQEAKEAFDGRLDDPYQQEIRLKDPVPFGSLQLMKLHLEHFLLHIYRRYQLPASEERKTYHPFSKTTKQKVDGNTFSRVTEYLHQHIDEKLTIEQICKDNIIGRSQLQKIFQEQSGLGIIEYFSHMKIDAAKQLMRNDQLNFTQISERLGYSSIHYFSRQFKKITGMTPSEYISSIKALSDMDKGESHTF